MAEKDPRTHLIGIAQRSGLLSELQEKIDSLNASIFAQEDPRWSFVSIVVDRFTNPVLYVTARKSTPPTTSVVTCHIRMDRTMDIMGAEEVYRGRINPSVDFTSLLDQAFANPHVQPETQGVSQSAYATIRNIQ